eukprot:gnl/MRDRNA2_/MRDRNA2_69458_c0_seq1.p1 gnl/MRDRNA2_/MRDRNA2_69458_c0~~gnl/MRDRNA2_/MRDRNA2_69458_c0_seq1.p1  ORF type:complete len:327 (+),score=53.27 gnl/MRDRNA2_/MRDRNA2_69458_c0_seq1:154-1134(+)
MVKSVIVSVFALVAVVEGILLTRDPITMGHGQHKKKARIRSFKDGMAPSTKALSPMSALDINASVAIANQQAAEMAADVFFRSDASNRIKQEVSKLFGVLGVKVNDTNLRSAPVDANETPDNQLSTFRLHDVRSKWANEVAPYPSQIFLKYLDDDQVAWLKKHGYLDDYLRLNERFMNPIMQAMYTFFLNTIPQNKCFLGVKVGVVGVFCNFFAISTCPWTPGQSVTQQLIEMEKYDTYIADGTSGTWAQSEQFEKMLIKFFYFLRGQSAPRINRIYEPPGVHFNPHLDWNGGGNNGGDSPSKGSMNMQFQRAWKYGKDGLELDEG